MSPVPVLVVGPSPDLGAFLAERLGETADPVTVIHVHPGSGLLDTIRSERPKVAVIDGIDQRPAAAKLEIVLLKDRCPDIRIIAVSHRPAESDGAIVEQSLFYYLAGGSRGQLTRVVEAAVAHTPGR